MQHLILAAIVAVAVAGPLRDQDPNDDTYLGLAWNAAAGELNQDKDGKFFVPKKIISAKADDSDPNAKKSVLEVLYQESWCSTEEGNDIADVCESMCPLYFGGAQAVYVVTTVEDSNGEPTVTLEKVRDEKNTEAL